MMYEQSNPVSQTASLEDYLRSIRNHWILVVSALLAGLLFGFWFVEQRVETYKADTAVAINPTPVGSTNLGLIAPSVERESEILASRKVADAVAAGLGLDLTAAQLLENVEVQFVPNSDVLQVTASGDEPGEVAALANAMVEVYQAQREAEAAEFNQNAIAVREVQLGEYQARVDAITTQLAELVAQQEAIAEADGPTGLIDAQIATLRNEQNQVLGSQGELERSIDEIQRAELTRQPAAEVIRLSQPPSAPSGIPSSLLIFGAALAGAILGLAVAFVMDRLDRSARDAQDLSLALGSNVLGEIPSFGSVGRVGTAGLIMLDDAAKGRRHRAQEAIRRLRSAVQFVAPTMGEEGCLVVAVSSAHPGEGKSTTAANLSIALAQSGSTVVLVSGDLRRPTIEQLFGVAAETGLSNLLSGADTAINMVESGVPNLWIIPAGHTPKNPSELLGVPLFETAVKELRTRADFVIIDTPPLLSVADGLVIGPKVDGLLIVVDSRTTDIDDLLKVRAETDRSGSVLIGGVLNRDRRRGPSMLKRDKYAYSQSADS